METQKLPSALQIGDYADVIISEGASILDEESILTACKCINVHFGLGSVRYDFEVLVSIDTARHVTRVYNIDSAFVHKRTSTHIDGMKEVKMIKLNKYLSNQSEFDSDSVRNKNNEAFAPIDKVFDGSWHTSIEKPKLQGEDYTDQVLIDGLGNRNAEDFAIGWYDFTEKKWRATDGEPLNEDQLVWQYLPLAKYDK